VPVIVIAGTIEIDPAKKDEAAAAALEIMRETHKEEGNLAYAFSQDLEDDGLIHIFEKWESQEALDFHFETPHMATFQKQVGSLGVKGMHLEKYEVSSVGSVF
jgi:quinol monooxygenase YgiN